MKKFTITLAIITCIILTINSIPSIFADEHFPIEGLFKKQGEVNIVTSKDTNYLIYLQLVIRNADGQLINITESTATGAFVPHPITDHVFDTLMKGEEVINIDGVEYEKGQWEHSPSLEHRFLALYPIYSEITIDLVVDPNDNTSKMYEKEKDYSIWKIHYCANFEQYGYNCIPVFQVLTPTMVLEPTDTVHKQWTVLRMLD